MRWPRLARVATVAALALAGSALAAPGAGADATFHFIKIREVFIGGGNPGAAFVELQTYAPDQANIAGHSITFYDATGVIIPPSPYPITADVPNGDNQRAILMGGPGVTPAPDFAHDIGAAVQTYGTGGAVCMDNLDCVSWGNFTGALPSPAGANAPAIPNGSSLERTIAVGCPTLLQDFDDTDTSQADFFVQPSPNPRNNATTPTEQSCLVGGSGPETRIDSGPKKKEKRKKAVFEFSSTAVGVTFECSVDGKAFTACSSPSRSRSRRAGTSFASARCSAACPTTPPPSRRGR